MKILLLDGYNLAYRSFYAVPMLTRSDGFPTNAVHGWIRTLWKLNDIYTPDEMLVFFDLDRSAYRLDLLPEYKANRSATPAEFKEQVEPIKAITRALGYSIIERKGIEADDLIMALGVYLNDVGHEVYMVSADKDLAQVIRPGLLQLLPPSTANPRLGWRIMNEEGVREKFGVASNQIVDYLALIGDSSDNIQGIPGVGPKTALKWLLEYSSLDGILNAIDGLKPERFRGIVKENKDRLMRNRQLIRLDPQLHGFELISLINEAAARVQIDCKECLKLLESFEMESTIVELRKRYKGSTNEQQDLFK